MEQKGENISPDEGLVNPITKPVDQRSKVSVKWLLSSSETEEIKGKSFAYTKVLRYSCEWLVKFIYIRSNMTKLRQVNKIDMLRT